VSGGASYYNSYGTNYYTKDNEFGYCLFDGCKKIEKVVLPNSLTTIGQCAFFNCTNLKTLVIGSKVTTIKPGLWGGCSKLTDVTINSANFHLTNGVLYNKDYTIIIAALQTWNYGDLSIRNGVKEIQYDAFSFCSNLTSLTFPSSVTTIGDTAFEYTGISSVVFTSYISSIGSFAFSGCKNLKELDLTPVKLTSLDYGAFMNSNIETVYMPKTLKELKQSVFSGTPLKNIFVYTATPATMYDLASSSPTFKNVDVSNCVVHVPQGKVNTYKTAAGWKDFYNITDSQEIESETDEAYAVYTTDGTLTFYYDKQKISRNGTKYELNTDTNTPGWYTEHYKDIKKVVFSFSFSEARPTSTYSWFATRNNNESMLSEIVDIQYLNTSSVTNMSRMFCYCNRLASLDLSHFDTSNVINMKEMFWFCTNLTSLDLSSFNTNKVTNMAYMFGGCSSLTMLDLGEFNTSSVTKMEGMYERCNKIKSLDLSQFDTRNVTDMSYMFEECSSLTNVDLCNFNTSRVTNMSHMFDHCGYLTTIYAGEDWNTSSVQQSGEMFNWCTSLVGGAGTKYDYNHVDKAYAHIDGGVGNPGYLTGKNTTPTLNLQEFINANAGATSVVTVDLSKFYDVVREVPLYVTTGASYRFINGTMDRAEGNSIPVMLISQGSKVEIGDGAVVTGRGNYANGCETIRMEGGTLNITQGVVEGSLGTPEIVSDDGIIVPYIGNPWQSNAVLLTSPNDHFNLSNGELYGLFSCTAEGADIQLKGGKMMGFGLREVPNDDSQQSPRRASPMGSRSPSINTYSDIHLKATTSEDFTWGYHILIPEDSTEADNLCPFHITLYEHNALYLQQSYEKGFAFTLYDKHEGDVIAVGENYNITQADIEMMTAGVCYTAGPPYSDDREAYLELKNNKVYLHFVSEEICSEDYLQQRLDEIAAQKPTEPVELTICPDGLTLTKSIHVSKDCKAIITGGPITSATSITYRYGGEGLFMVYGELGFKDISLNLTNDSKSDGCLGYFWLGDGKLQLGKGTSVVTTNGTVVGGWGDLEVTDAVIQAGGEDIVISDQINAAITEYIFLVGQKTYCNGKLSVDMKTDANTGSVKLPVFQVGQVNVSTSLDLWAPKNMLRQLYLHKDATINTYTDGFVHLPLAGEWEQMTLGRAFITSPSITLEDYSRMTFSGMPTNRRAEFVANSHQVRLMSASQLNIQTLLAVLNNSSAASSVTLNLAPDAVTVVNQSSTVNHKDVTFDGLQSGSGSRGRLHFADRQTLTITLGSCLTLKNIDVTGEGTNNGFIVNGNIVLGENVHVSDLPCMLHVGSSGRVVLSAQPVSVITMEFIGGIADGQIIVVGTDDYRLQAADLEYIQVNGCELLLDETNNRIIAINATGIESIATDTEAKDGAGEYYDLSGRRVASPCQGTYILRKGGKTRKIFIK